MKYRVVVFYNEMIIVGKEFGVDELNGVKKVFENINGANHLSLSTDDNKIWYFPKDIVQKMIFCIEQIDDKKVRKPDQPPNPKKDDVRNPYEFHS